jgi:hypothetical protein
MIILNISRKFLFSTGLFGEAIGMDPSHFCVKGTRVHEPGYSKNSRREFPAGAGQGLERIKSSPPQSWPALSFIRTSAEGFFTHSGKNDAARFNN